MNIIFIIVAFISNGIFRITRLHSNIQGDTDIIIALEQNSQKCKPIIIDGTSTVDIERNGIVKILQTCRCVLWHKNKRKY